MKLAELTITVNIDATNLTDEELDTVATYIGEVVLPEGAEETVKRLTEIGLFNKKYSTISIVVS